MATLDKQYRLIGAKVTQFSFNNKQAFADGGVDYDVKLAVKFANAPEKDELKLLTTISEVDIREKDSATVLVTLEVQTIFEILDFEALFALPKDGQSGRVIDQRFYESIAKISISITRGILLEKLSATPLHDTILPLAPFEY